MADSITALLNESMTSKRGVTLALAFGTVALVVTEVTDSTVSGRSQQYDRIVVRLDRVDAAYM